MLKVTLFLRYLHQHTLKDLLRQHLDGIAMPKVTLFLRQLMERMLKDIIP